MELFKDGQKFKDFYLQNIYEHGTTSVREKLDSNELFYRMTGWEKEFRDLFGGKVTKVVIPHDGWDCVFGWNRVN